MSPFAQSAHGSAGGRRILSQRDAQHFLQLAVAEGCGQGMVAPLLDPDARPADLLRAPPELPFAVRRRLVDARLDEVARAWRRAADRAGLTCMTPACARYPTRALNISS